MKNTMKRALAIGAAFMMAFSMSACSAMVDKIGGWFGKEKEPARHAIILKNVTEAKNVILLIGDGMGPQQIKTGEIYKGQSLTMQGFPYKATVETCSASDMITDSAAAATALATGVRTTNGVVGRNQSLEDLETIVDIAHGLGKSTGIIATEELFGATPMGFSGHSNSRDKSDELISSAATSSNVNLFASYMITAPYQKYLTDAGYEKIVAVDGISEATSDKIFGCYPIRATAPSMSAGEEMGTIAFNRVVTEALEYLSKDEDGFFLMAEGSHIDHGGHNNDIEYMLEELLAFDDAVLAVLEWAKDRDDTVVIVAADHETGGLQLREGATSDNLFDVAPSGASYGLPLYYSWSTKGHTATEVNCYINGADIDFSNYSFGSDSRIKNTDVFQIMKGLLTGTIK